MLTQISVGTQTWETDFATFLRVEGRSEKTAQAYVSDVKAFARWFEGVNRQGFAPELVTGVDLRAWRAWAVEGHMTPKSWNRRRIGLKVFCAWLQELGVLAYDPFQGVDEWAEEELPPRWLTKAEQTRFLRQVEVQVNGARTEAARWRAVRDQALAALMLQACLREGEVTALDVKDVEISERKGRVVVWSGKGSKKREVPLNAEARRALGAWLELARPQEPLFWSEKGRGAERLSTRTIQRVVAELGRLAGLELTPHELRHSGAKRMADAGVPLTVIQKILGHARLSTTARYIQPGWEDFESAVERI